MNKNLNKSLIAAAVVAALGSPIAANAASGVLFDITGTGNAGTALNITQFGWQTDAILALGFFPNTNIDVDSAVGGIAGTTLTGTLYGTGQLTSVQLFGGGSGAVPGGSTGNPVFTYEFALDVTATVNKKANGNISFTDIAILPALGNNVFNVYYDATSRVNLGSGVGFGLLNGEVDPDAKQKVILSGHIKLKSGAFGQSGATPDGLTVDDPLDTNTPNPAGPWTIDGNGSLSLDINVCNASEVAQPLSATNKCTSVDTVDSKFFPNSSLDALSIDVNLADGMQLPFIQFIPPALVANKTPNLGVPVTFTDSAGVVHTTAQPLNNYSCDALGSLTNCDLILQSSGATSSVNGSVLPEPGILALFGAGLAGFGWSARRQRKNAA